MRYIGIQLAGYFLALSALGVGLVTPAHADPRYDVKHECTEYYPNGTDCKKTKRIATPKYHCHEPKEVRRKMCAEVGLGSDGKPKVECRIEVETKQDCHT